eukprot:363803-Chlamydomonas_euryale.AAC.9
MAFTAGKAAGLSPSERRRLGSPAWQAAKFGAGFNGARKKNLHGLHSGVRLLRGGTCATSDDALRCGATLLKCRRWCRVGVQGVEGLVGRSTSCAAAAALVSAAGAVGFAMGKNSE